MVVVIAVHELWPVLTACRVGSVMHLIKVGVNQPAIVVIVSSASMDVLEGREKERYQECQARF